MTVISLRIVGSENDASQRADGSVFTSTTAAVGVDSHATDPALRYHAGLRFGPVNEAQGATVDPLDLRVFLDSDKNDSPDLTIWAEAADNAADFATSTTVNGRTLGTATVTWDATDLAVGYQSIDVTSLAQEVVNRPGWVSGNYIVLVLKGSSATTRTFAFQGQDSGVGDDVAELQTSDFRFTDQFADEFDGAQPPTNQAYSRTVTDTVGADDAVIVTKTHARTLTDGVGAADTLTRTVTFTVTLVDSVGAVDVLTRTAETSRSVTDEVGAVDTVTTDLAVAHARTISDGVGAVDQVVTVVAVTHTRTITDDLGAVDTSSTATDSTRTLTDGVGVDSALAGRLETDDEVGITDTLVISVSSASAQSISITDTVGTSDVVALTGTYARALVDTVGASDVVVVTHVPGGGTGTTHTRTITDAVGGADDTNDTARELLEEIIDGVGLVAPFAASLIGEDRAGITDFLAITIFRAVGATHTVTITDGVGGADANDPQLSTLIDERTDPVGITAPVRLELTTDADTVGVTDLLIVTGGTRAAAHLRTLDDTVGADDTLVALRSNAITWVVTLTDDVGVDDVAVVRGVPHDSRYRAWLAPRALAAILAAQRRRANLAGQVDEDEVSVDEVPPVGTLAEQPRRAAMLTLRQRRVDLEAQS